MTVSRPNPQVKPLALIPQDYREIPLSKGMIARVSPEDYDRVIKFKWSVSFIKGRPYATRGKKQANGKQSCEFMHRYILQPEPGQQVDHANHDTLDNRRWSPELNAGIRIATIYENMSNRGRQSNNSSGFIGVKALPNGRFRADIGHDGKHTYIGMFATAVEAAIARDWRAVELHKTFAVLNFPLESQPLPIAA